MTTTHKLASAFFFAVVSGLSFAGPASAQVLPGSGTMPNDGWVVAGLYQACGGEPRCMAAAWATVEVTRCRQGIGNPGGCFGPNGEIMRALNNMRNDVIYGPSDSNDLVGRDGWLRRRLGF